MHTVIVANRGEIAVRIVRACRELGLRSVAVFSDADAGALHVRLADAAHRIGPAPASASYLSVDALLAAAHDSGADAVHPGYGLLSEDARFAAAVADAGLVWVGPPADVIERMGDKVAARRAARDAGVPVLPGADVGDADALGFPLMVKASFGGGGRGMRVVRDAGDLDAAVASATREAGAAFGRGDVFLERHLDRPRHVEIQVLADAHGTVVHLGDRDCTVQRRHQKMIEEAPAPLLPDDVRTALHDAAVGLAREVGYVGAGTVEFLLVPGSGEWYFLEMNTRLQVEHGVTELVTGVDLVAAQLAVAAGEKLDLAQDDVTVTGHAIQARIAAEDPAAGFRPGPGPVRTLHLPTGPWVRCDTGVEAGDAVAPHYDSLFAKILARGPDRDTARRRLGAALDELVVDGVPTTAGYLRAVLDESAFVEVTHDTGSVERDWSPAVRTTGGVAGADRDAGDSTSDGRAASDDARGDRTGPDPTAADRTAADPDPAAAERAGVGGTGTDRVATDGAATGRTEGFAAVGSTTPGAATSGTTTSSASPSGATTPGTTTSGATTATRTRRVRISTDRGPVEIAVPTLADRAERAGDAREAGGRTTPGSQPTAPMDATVVDVPVEAGATVAAGDVLVVLEAMKMEIEVRAPHAGTVVAVHVTSGAPVGAGAVLAEVRPAQ